MDICDMAAEEARQAADAKAAEEAAAAAKPEEDATKKAKDDDEETPATFMSKPILENVGIDLRCVRGLSTPRCC